MRKNYALKPAAKWTSLNLSACNMGIGVRGYIFRGGAEYRLVESESDISNSTRIMAFISLLLLWLFGPSILAVTDLNCTIAAFAWILQYSYVSLAFSSAFIIPDVMGFMLHLSRFFFLLYVVQSLGKTTEFKKTLSFGILTELPFIFVAVCYALFPLGLYSYYLAAPVPIMTIIAILLLMWKSQ